MFQFRAFPSYAYLIQRTIPEYCSGVLPHSDISGSTLICSSPKLFAACHVLHRLLMPRHSPCALYSLTCVEALASIWFSIKNYAGSTEDFQNCIYPIKKVPQFIACDLSIAPLCCLAFLSFLCSVFKVQVEGIPSKLNNVRLETLRLPQKRSDLGFYTRLVIS